MSDLKRDLAIQEFNNNVFMDGPDPRGYWTQRSEWSYSLPSGNYNLVDNPSLETNDFNWGATGGTTLRNSFYSSRGVWSLAIVPNGFGAGGSCFTSVDFTIPTPGLHAFHIDVWGSKRNRYLMYVEPLVNLAGNPLSGVHDFWGCGFWNRESIHFEIPWAGRWRITVEHLGLNNNSDTYFLDGAHVHRAARYGQFWDYVDGDVPTAIWDGVWHESTSGSEPDASTPQEYFDFRDLTLNSVAGEGARVHEWFGVSAPPHKQILQSQPYHDGGILQRTVIPSRVFGFSGYLHPDSKLEYHKLSQTLETNSILQPLDRRMKRIYFQPFDCGKPVKRKVFASADYKDGLDGIESNYRQRKFTIRFQAPDPYFYAFHEDGHVLNPNGFTLVNASRSRLSVHPTIRVTGPGNWTSIENLYPDNVRYPTRIEFDPTLTTLTGTEIGELWLSPGQIRFWKFDINNPNAKTVVHGAVLPGPNSNVTRFYLGPFRTNSVECVSSYAQVEMYWRDRLISAHDR